MDAPKTDAIIEDWGYGKIGIAEMRRRFAEIEQQMYEARQAAEQIRSEPNKAKFFNPDHQIVFPWDP